MELRTDLNWILINGNKGLYKIVFCQTLAAGIDSNKNVCYIFFVCGIADFQRGQRIIREIEKRIDIIFDSIFFLVGQQREFFFTASFIGLFDETTPERTNGIIFFRKKHITNTADPFRVPFICLRPHSKFTSQWIVRNFDLTVCKVFIFYLYCKHCRHESCETLLTVNHKFFGFFICFCILSDGALSISRVFWLDS